MVITVVAVGMVQVPINQIIDMVTMGDGFVAASGSVHMGSIVPGALMRGGAVCWVGTGYTDGVLVNVIAVGVMQVPVVKVINVAIMGDGRMPAIWAMGMRVVWVLVARHY